LTAINIPLTDAGLIHVSSLKNLRTLDVRVTEVTAAGVAALHEGLPECKIIWGDYGNPTTVEPTVVADPDRRAAEWVLGKGGMITIEVEGIGKVNINEQRRTDLVAADVLPMGHFELQAVNLYGKTDIGDADLIHLEGLQHLNSLALNGTSVTAVCLQQLQTLPGLIDFAYDSDKIDEAAMKALLGLKQLTGLGMMGGKVSADNVHSLKALPNLSHLWLGYAEIDDATFVRVGELTQLTSLLLVGSRFNEANLERLKTLTALDRLGLNSTPLTDAGLIHLATFKSLRELNLERDEVTAAGVATLQEALPDCKIEWDDPANAKP